MSEQLVARGAGTSQETEQPLIFPPRLIPWGPATATRACVAAAAYLGILTLAYVMVSMTTRIELVALALGLAFPGAGFLAWMPPAEPLQIGAVLAVILSFAGLVGAMFVWFATGNVVLPPIMWIGAAVASAFAEVFGFSAPTLDTALSTASCILWVLLIGLVLGSVTQLIRGYRGLSQRRQLNALLAGTKPYADAKPSAPPDEMSFDDLRRLRLLLDRALQPIDRFDGFEQGDQFQTAALRYQINFMSYALAIAGHNHLPAFAGYLLTAQRNLATKQLDPQIWRYWYLENLWGNLSGGRDPMSRGNIMFAGFLAAQLAYARQAGGLHDFDTPASLTLRTRSGEEFAYSLPALVERLTGQFQRAQYGLLSCEPHWIYPLCNLITATGVKAADSQYATTHWDRIEASVRRSLEREFITADGRIVPFRSALLGAAHAGLGGAVMQAFPCLFLNSLFPDIALRQWRRFRIELGDLTIRRLRRMMWPIDVGNYRLTRASSYAATAAAAVEMGDTETADVLFGLLDSECPSLLAGGVTHRVHASLWAHAVELIARLGRHNGLRMLVTHPPDQTQSPYVRAACYPDVLVARARNRHGSLLATLYPGDNAGIKSLTIGGLRPHATYVADAKGCKLLQADCHGEASLSLPVDGRTDLRISLKAA